MNFFRLLIPIIRKEFRQIRRDPTSMGMLLALPAGMILLVGYALNFDVKHIPFVVYDQDRTVESRDFLRPFKNSEYFSYLYDVDSYRDIERAFMDGTARMAVVLPRSFGKDHLDGVTSRVQLLLDGSDANSAGQAVGYATRLTMDYSSRLLIEARSRQGKTFSVPIAYEPRIWYNPDLVTSRFMIPGLIGLILILTAVISTAMAVVREKERGTMEQIMVSPLKPFQVILGKTVPYFAISLVAATGILILGYLLFDVEVAGSLLLLYAGIATLVLAGLGQGLLISSVTDSQQVAYMAAMLSSLLPSFLLSGFVFPISNMPVVLQVLSNVAVNKFFLVVVRGIMLRGVGFSVLWPQFVFMLLFAAITMGVSILRMNKREV